MLIDGEIDLLSDVSFKPERAELMLYPALAMGAESYYIYIDAGNTVINPEDVQTLGGKRIGVNKGSFQEGLLAQWAEENGVAIEIVEMDGDEAYSMVILAQGETDCVFPINMSTSSGAAAGMLTTNSIMQTETSLLMRAEDRPEIAPGSALTVAIDAGNTNYETLIREGMPNWTIVSCAYTPRTGTP